MGSGRKKKVMGVMGEECEVLYLVVVMVDLENLKVKRRWWWWDFEKWVR